jgi:hypothetical protein
VRAAITLRGQLHPSVPVGKDEPVSEGGFIMRIVSVVKVAVLAFAVALPLSASVALAKTMKLAPGACAFEKKGIATGTICSYQCNTQTNWCAQQLCINGALTQIVPCFSGFCAPKCGG